MKPGSLRCFPPTVHSPPPLPALMAAVAVWLKRRYGKANIEKAEAEAKTERSQDKHCDCELTCHKSIDEAAKYKEEEEELDDPSNLITPGDDEPEGMRNLPEELEMQHIPRRLSTATIDSATRSRPSSPQTVTIEVIVHSDNQGYER